MKHLISFNKAIPEQLLPELKGLGIGSYTRWGIAKPFKYSRSKESWWSKEEAEELVKQILELVHLTSGKGLKVDIAIDLPTDQPLISALLVKNLVLLDPRSTDKVSLGFLRTDSGIRNELSWVGIYDYE